LIDQADLLNDQKTKVKFFADMADKTAEPWTNFVRMILTLGIGQAAPAPVVAPVPAQTRHVAAEPPAEVARTRVIIQKPQARESGFKLLPTPGLGR
jgi:hypothetical protein